MMNITIIIRIFSEIAILFSNRLILNGISKHAIMMLAAVIQVVIVNVCVQPLLLMPENVIDMVYISNGDHKDFVVSLIFSMLTH
jgi:hypothetical protein